MEALLSAGVAGAIKLFVDEAENDSSDEDEILFLSQRTNHKKIDNYVANVVMLYNPSDFKSHFRLQKTSIEQLCVKLESIAPQQVSGRPKLKPINALLITIWTLANTECYRSIADRFGVTLSCAHTCFIRTCKLICALKDEYIKWPSGIDLERTVQDFNELRGPNSFPNVVGCVDGSHITIRGVHDNSYYNRKGYYSMLLQVICNSRREFTDVFCGWPGSSHDSRMWQNSPIYHKIINENLINSDHHLLGDSAYPLKTFIMVPFRDNGHLTRNQKKYNYVLSSSRVVVENSIGLLKGVFRRLRYVDILNLKYFKYIVIAACILHNFRLKFEDDDFQEEFGNDDFGDIPFQAVCDERQDTLAKNKREQLVIKLSM